MDIQEQILVLDFGGQYNQLIARRVRDLAVYSEVLPHDTSIEEIQKRAVKGIIFTGGPNVVTAEGAPSVDARIFELGIPILGICYGAQLMAYSLGGGMEKAKEREYGGRNLELVAQDALLESVAQSSQCWMSHTYQVSSLPEGFVLLAKTKTCPFAAFGNEQKQLYGLQFHPEVQHSEFGNKILENFLYNICKCQGLWKMQNLIDEEVAKIREQVGSKKVLCALSGGVDSSVAAALVHKAIGEQLVCVFVNNGLMRLDEPELVERVFRQEQDIQLIHVDASQRFLENLTGVSDPERKRKIIGETFIRVFEDTAKELGDISYLVQGTIYPDVIESGSKHAALIKTHHNVGGLPDIMDFEAVIEPLRLLFKDEVRRLGLLLGLPEHIVYRQPFPGPGLAIRIMGAVEESKLEILRHADAIFREELEDWDTERSVWQYFAVLTNTQTVGVMGDERSYQSTLALRAVSSIDGMTADWSRLPWELLSKASQRIVNEVDGINRIVYDITSKPPATIEWE